jgi:PTS system mannose-specific IIA component
MIGILIVTHGKFGEEMLESAQAIVGRQGDIKTLELPSEEALEALKYKLKGMLAELDQGQGVLILTDMLGGTPCNICLPYVRTMKASIVSGVNLYMILAAIVHRSKMTLNELTMKVVESGQRNISDVGQKFLGKK